MPSTRAIIVTHGSLGAVLLEAVETVLGPQSDVEVLSNEGLSLEQAISVLHSRLAESPALLFVDFCGGSPYVACRTIRERFPECALISGVNLPMLLSFFTKRDQLPFTKLAEVVESDGHRGIQLLCA